MTIFEPLGRVPVRPRPRRYGVNVFGIRCEGTIREWLEDGFATVLMAVFFVALYVYAAVIV